MSGTRYCPRISAFLTVVAMPLALAVSMTATPTPAAAQSLFDLLFGVSRRLPPTMAYAPPSEPLPENRSRAPARPAGPAMAYCVRTCDGRFFPVQSNANASPAQLCQSFCPASPTAVLRGSSIESARSHDGTRYGDMPNAFVYRERVVSNCTCNGKDAFGLATVNPQDDPTLRKGDIVATSEGLVAYTGKKTANSGELNFTPAESYRGLPKSTRQALSHIKINTHAAAKTEAPAPQSLSTAEAPIPSRYRAQLSR